MREVKDYIGEYFKDYRNVSNKEIYQSFNSQTYTPEVFYKLRETEQARCHVMMKKITCKDGFTVSVQATYTHYCSPRETIRSEHFNFYNEFELGFPNKKDKLLMPYCEDNKRPKDTVYSCVPKDIINQVIKKHGGLLTN